MDFPSAILIELARRNPERKLSPNVFFAHLPRRHSSSMKICTSQSSRRIKSAHGTDETSENPEKASNRAQYYKISPEHQHYCMFDKTRTERHAQESSTLNKKRGDSSEYSGGSRRFWSFAFYAYIFDRPTNKTSSEWEVLHPLKISRFWAAVWRTIHTPRDLNTTSPVLLLAETPANQPSKEMKPEMALLSFDAKTEKPDVRENSLLWEQFAWGR